RSCPYPSPLLVTPPCALYHTHRIAPGRANRPSRKPPVSPMPGRAQPRTIAILEVMCCKRGWADAETVGNSLFAGVGAGCDVTVCAGAGWWGRRNRCGQPGVCPLSELALGRHGRGFLLEWRAD